MAKLPAKRVILSLSIVAIILAICIISVTTAFSVNHGWHDLLLRYFGATEEQIESLSTLTGYPATTLRQDDITITVNQTIIDSYGIYVLYEIVLPDSIKLRKDTDVVVRSTVVPTNSSDDDNTFGISTTKVLEQSGNRITVLQHDSSTTPIIDGTVTLYVLGINYVVQDSDPSRIETLLHGRWSLKWEHNSPSDTNINYEANIPISINGSENTITRIVITPVSISIFINGDDILRSAHPIVSFVDGSHIDYDMETPNSSFTYFLSDESDMIYTNQLYYRFESIISIDNIESITIGDVTIRNNA